MSRLLVVPLIRQAGSAEPFADRLPLASDYTGMPPAMVRFVPAGNVFTPPYTTGAFVNVGPPTESSNAFVPPWSVLFVIVKASQLF